MILKLTFTNAWMQLDFSEFVLDNFGRNKLIDEALILSRSKEIKFSYFKSISDAKIRSYISG